MNEWAKAAAGESTAAAVFLVRNSYAYEMQTGSLKDWFVETLAKHIMPEKWVGILTGPSQIQAYDLVSDVWLVRRDGAVAWRFFGKGQAFPSFKEMFRPGEFVRSVAGLDPSEQGLARVLSGMAESYTTYLGWVMDQDFKGNARTNYYSDYPSELRRRGLGIFPARDRSHTPFVLGYDPTEIDISKP